MFRNKAEWFSVLNSYNFINTRSVPICILLVFTSRKNCSIQYCRLDCPIPKAAFTAFQASSLRKLQLFYYLYFILKIHFWTKQNLYAANYFKMSSPNYFASTSSPFIYHTPYQFDLVKNLLYTLILHFFKTIFKKPAHWTTVLSRYFHTKVPLSLRKSKYDK